MKRITFLLLALFLACEPNDETTANGLPSDEVAWLHVGFSRCHWIVLGTDDSLRYTVPGYVIYGQEGCEEYTNSYALRGDSLIWDPGAEDEQRYQFAVLDSGRVLRQSWEDDDSRWCWDSTLDLPTDCAAYEALAGIDAEYVGTGLLQQGEATPDTFELRVWAESGFLWVRAYGQPGLFTLGICAQPGARTVSMLAGASAYSNAESTYYLDNGQLALASYSSAGVSGVFTGLFYDRDTRPSGQYDADISLRLEFEAIATPVEAASPQGPRQVEPWGVPAR